MAAHVHPSPPHTHHAHAHVHPPGAHPAQPPAWSMLGLPALTRLGLALGLSAALWAAVLLAMR